MLFSNIEDKRGYKISCTKDQWYNHILNRHPNMTGFEQEIIEAIKNPDLPIFKDSGYNDRNIYYSIYKKIQGTNFYIKVIVQINEEELSGTVVTAFKTFNVKPGEMMI
jgi:hypothetical protein